MNASSRHNNKINNLTVQNKGQLSAKVIKVAYLIKIETCTIIIKFYLWKQSHCDL